MGICGAGPLGGEAGFQFRADDGDARGGDAREGDRGFLVGDPDLDPLGDLSGD